MRTFFNPENWLADKNKLFPCLLVSLNIRALLERALQVLYISCDSMIPPVQINVWTKQVFTMMENLGYVLMAAVNVDADRAKLVLSHVGVPTS